MTTKEDNKPTVEIVSIEERTNAKGEIFRAAIIVGPVYINGVYKEKFQWSIPSSLPVEILKNMIGTKLDGKIKRIESDPYWWTNPDTGEEMLLHHKY